MNFRWSVFCLLLGIWYEASILYAQSNQDDLFYRSYPNDSESSYYTEYDEYGVELPRDNDADIDTSRFHYKAPTTTEPYASAYPPYPMDNDVDYYYPQTNYPHKRTYTVTEEYYPTENSYDYPASGYPSDNDMDYYYQWKENYGQPAPGEDFDYYPLSWD